MTCWWCYLFNICVLTTCSAIVLLFLLLQPIKSLVCRADTLSTWLYICPVCNVYIVHNACLEWGCVCFLCNVCPVCIFYCV